MKKNIRGYLKKLTAAFLAGAILFTGASMEGFAAKGNAAKHVASVSTARVSLYQDGALSAAYSVGDDFEKYQMPEEGTAAYVLYQGMLNFETEIDLTDFEIPVDNALEEIRKTINANGDLFYVSNVLSYSYYDDGTIACFNPKYIAEESELAAMKLEFDKAAESALAGTSDTMSDLEKALYVHDYLIRNNSYNYKDYQSNTVPNVDHSAYGCLVNGLSVCDGYALAFSYLMGRLGVSTRLVTSDAMGHAWNAVKIDGEWYFADLTHDDPVSYLSDGSIGDVYDRINHSAFLLSTAELSNTAYGSVKYNGWAQTDIDANSDKYKNAFWKNSSTEFGYYNGNWYYLDEESGYIMKTDSLGVEANGTIYLDLSSLRWPEIGGNRVYLGVYSKITLWNEKGLLFYNDADKVYYIDLNKSEFEAVPYYTNTDSSVRIYGVSVKTSKSETKLAIGLAANPSQYETVIYDTNISNIKTEKPVDPDVMIGDANGDKSIKADDALTVLKYVAGIIDENAINKDAADVDNSSTITSSDALGILKFLAGIITSFEKAQAQ